MAASPPSPGSRSPGPALQTYSQSPAASKAPSRSQSVRFLDRMPPQSIDPTETSTAAANHSAAESSADEITPIISHERGSGKGRSYAGLAPNSSRANDQGECDDEEEEDDYDFGSKRRDGQSSKIIGLEDKSKGVVGQPGRSKSGSTTRQRRKKTGSRSINGAEGSDHEEESMSRESSWIHWLKNLADKYGSIELDNKGSVARDHLALERTFLAWLRTSLAFASIGIAITQLFRLNTTINEGKGYAPENPPHAVRLRQMGKPLGATFLGIAVLVLLLGGRRYFESQYWIVRGKFPASRGSVFLLTFIAVALIITSLVIVCVIDPSVFEKK